MFNQRMLSTALFEMGPDPRIAEHNVLYVRLSAALDDVQAIRDRRQPTTEV